MTQEIEVVISQIRQNLGREYELFIHSTSYQSYKNSEVQTKAQFLTNALKAMKYPHTNLIPLGGGIYKLLNFDHFELDLNLFNTPSFHHKTAFIDWVSKNLYQDLYAK
ncbi:hypothetical protein [Acinetobacter gyllenbergii]